MPQQRLAKALLSRQYPRDPVIKSKTEGDSQNALHEDEHLMDYMQADKDEIARHPELPEASDVDPTIPGTRKIDWQKVFERVHSNPDWMERIRYIIAHEANFDPGKYIDLEDADRRDELAAQLLKRKR